MWHNIQEDPPYLLLSKEVIKSYEIYVTDYISIWFVYFKKNDFLECLKDSNFGLEVEPEELLQKGAKLLKQPTNLRKLEVKKNVSTLEISMTKLFEYPLQLKLKLTEGSKEMFFQNVSYMLLKTVADLKTSQQELRDLLKKKDDEIEEYKSEGKEIALRYLKTKQFNDEEHMRQHQVDKECADLLNIPNTLLDKIAAATHRNEAIERENLENLNIKQEPTTPSVSQSAPCISSDVKIEPKIEPQNNSFSPRKKRKQLLNY
ncbi:uncharacterized protein LOC134664470 isoform X4 [Cydia fagiglandana]|uniref:uncharacterized protein LOC134664470 isoform X4 n=1 Tax=Cydia fagiglandana TaxID=1458189 RepID=UPI002FEE12E6